MKTKELKSEIEWLFKECKFPKTVWLNYYEVGGGLFGLIKEGIQISETMKPKEALNYLRGYYDAKNKKY